MANRADDGGRRVLIVEDDEELAALEALWLGKGGYRAEVTHRLDAAREAVAKEAPDLVVVDYKLPDGDAATLLDWLLRQHLDLPVVVVTGRGDERVAVDMMKRGASDYLVKSPETAEVLPEVVGRAIAQQRLKRELREAQERYRFLVNQTDDMISVHDLEGRFLFASPTSLALTGYQEDRLRGTRLSDYFHTDDLARLRGRGSPLASAAEPHAVEYRFRTRWGVYRWVETISHVVFGPDREPKEIIAATRDLSERKAAEERDRAYTTLLEALHGLSTTAADDKSMVAFVSQLLQGLLKKTSADAAIVHLEDEGRLVPRAAVGDWPTDLDTWEIPLADLGQTDDAVVREWQGRALRGGEAGAWLARAGYETAMAFPFRSSGGVRGVTHLLALRARAFGKTDADLLRVVSERCAVHIETAMLYGRVAASEARYRELVETIPDLLWETDLDGRIQFVNSAAADLLGQPPSALIGIRLGELLEPSDREGWWQACDELRARDLPFEGVFGFRHAKGHVRELSVKGYLRRDADGAPRALAGSARDVTGERLMEERLRTAQKLEAVGRLAGSVAQDFDRILDGILASSQALRDRLPASSPLKRDVDGIARAAERAASLTRQLLAFGRRQRMDLLPVALNDVVRDMMLVMQRTVGVEIGIQLDCDTDLPPVRVDAGKIEQVLMNLCLNARDAMPDGGRITIATSAVELSEEALRGEPHAEPGRFARLAFADTGLGMDETIKARIFEPYFTTKGRRREHEGLGLATVHGIVTAHGGLVRVDSAPGRGTSFEILLPALLQESEESQPAAEAKADGAEALPARGAGRKSGADRR